MSTSRVINRWLNRVYKSIAILLVLFAVLISALRLFLPYVEDYKDGLENFINDANNSQITIGQLSMEWEKLGPSIVLNQVQLLETQSTDIFIDTIHVHLDFWQSLMKGRVITQDVTLSGAEVVIKSISNSSNDKDKPLIARITEVFLDQISRFSLLDSQVIFQNSQTEKVLLINQLDWLNEGDKHRGKGYVILDGLTSNNIKVLLDLHGDDLEDLDGQVYLQANQLNITPWLDTVLAIDNKDTHSAINFDGWLTIDKGFPSSLLVALGNNEISWIHNKTEQFFSINQGYVLTSFDDGLNEDHEFNRFNISSSPLTIITPKNTWESTSVQFSKNIDVYNGFISHLNVQGLTEISPLFLNNPKVTKLLSNISPKGLIEDSFVQIIENKVSVVSNIKQINSSPFNGIPGVSNLGGEISFQNNTLGLNLNAKDGFLDFAEHFVKPIPYHLLSIDTQLNFKANAWQLTSNDIQLTSDEIQIGAELVVEKPEGEDVKMSLLASIGKADTAYINHYFPQLVMGKNLVSYLNSAIVKGNIEQAQVLFNGPINKFPFENNEGVFTVDTEISDAEFSFDPAWPAIKNFNANLNFTNNSMLITGRNGSLENIDVRGVTVAIEDLKGTTILEVDAGFEGVDAEDVRRLMNKSPLHHTVGTTLNSLMIAGPISGDFSLNLPLKDLESVVAKGSVTLDKNTIHLQSPNMIFSEVKGQLTYINDKISTNDVSLLWRDMPLTLAVNANNKGAYYNTNITMKADWEDNRWLKQIPDKLKHYGEGNIAWQGNLSLNSFKDGNFTYDLNIDSSLKQLSLNLPQPYQKNKDQTVTFTSQISGQKNSTTINAKLGDQLTFYGALDHAAVTFTKAHLALGREEMLLPTKGFHISANLFEASVEEWQPFLFDIIDELQSAKTDNLPKALENKPVLLKSPERITGAVGTLSYQNYDLSDVKFAMDNSENNWLLDLNSKELRSQVILHNNFFENGLEINADFIHLSKRVAPQGAITQEPIRTNVGNLAVKLSDNITEPLPASEGLTLLNKLVEHTASSIDSKQEIFTLDKRVYEKCPPIVMNCASCKVDNIDLGQLSFNINRNDDNNLTLENLKASRDKFSLTLDGVWAHKDGQNTTSLEGSLDIKDLEQETERLGYTPTIKDSGLKSHFTFNWQASPYEFSIDKLNGQFDASLDDGYLTEVPDQARVFSVLSLQSLVRKLSFDFRDIFADGMFYQNINGDFQLKNGIMYTDNMFMKGAAGDLEVKGNTDLSKELLDIRMSYKPNVTSSLPALAWIATLNPVAFLAGLALEEVITSKVYYEMNFELTGSMSQPILKDVNRKTRNISVGKTTPPQIIDDLSVPDATNPIIQKEINNEPNTQKSLNKSEVDG